MWPSKSRSQIFRITLQISEILMFIVVFAVAIVQARRSHAERLEVRPTRRKIGLASIHKKGSRAPISADCFCPDRKTRGQAGTNIPTAYICKDCHHQGTRVALLSWLLSTDFQESPGLADFGPNFVISLISPIFSRKSFNSGNSKYILGAPTNRSPSFFS